MIRLRYNLTFIILCMTSCLYLSATFSYSQGKKTSEQAYLDAYMLKSEAENAQEAGNLKKAHTLFKKASRSYDIVAKTWPSWQPELINIRREQIRENISQIGSQLQAQRAESAPSEIETNSSYPLPDQSKTNNYNSTPNNETGSLTDFMQGLKKKEQEYQQKIREAESSAYTTKKAHESTKKSYKLAIQELSTLKTQYQELAQQKTKAEEIIKQKTSQASKNTADKERVIAELEKTKSELNTFTKKEKELESQLNLANQKSTEQFQEIELLNKSIADIQAEKKEIVKQRDEMDAIASTKGGSSETEKKLLDENRRLRQRLATALQDVANLKKENVKKDQRIAKLESEVVDLRNQIKTLEKENIAYQSRITELTNRLKTQSQELAENPEILTDPILATENEILRTIVTRQIKRLAMKKQRGLLLAEQLEQSGVQEKSLLTQIETLVDHRILLTEEEQLLFKGTEALEQNDSIITLMAPEEVKEIQAQAEKSTPETLLENANNQFKEGNYEKTELFYQQYLKTGDLNKASAVLGNLGVVQMKMKQFPESESSLKQAILKNPQNAFIHFNLGFNHLWQNKINDSVLNLENSIQLDPNNSKAHFYLGVAHARSGKLIESKQAFQNAIKVNSNYADAYYNLAVLYALDGKGGIKLAKENYKKALDNGLSPDANLEGLLNSV